MPTDLSKIYELRTSFNIIGLTGRIGSGCTDVAKLLNGGFENGNFPKPKRTPTHNTDRKYSIVYKFAKENVKPYYLIEYKDVLSLFIFKEEFETIKTFIINFCNSEDNIQLKKNHFDQLWGVYPKINTLISKQIFNRRPFDKKKLYRFFKSPEFKKASKVFNDTLVNISAYKRIEILHEVSNNIRKSGKAFQNTDFDASNVYKIVETINNIIKGYKEENKYDCKIVIDSLRNPLEVLFFKERYSAFYMISVNREENEIVTELSSRYGTSNLLKIQSIDKEEYKGGSDTEFYKQNISECVQKSDIHLSNISEEEAFKFNIKNKKNNNNTSPKFSLKQQILKYLSSMYQPGIITPSPEERSMQIAYTAKYNSGCISRQVGAVVTDENYSIKAVGWNNTPEGQVPCLLRNSDDLIKGKDKKAFSNYEINKDELFNKKFKDYYKNLDATNLKGRNVSFCFKCIQNSIKEGKNQVHTRSLHAEESAFLQITKYGGQGVQNGKLFTTASPCELCSKKAYQLGIEVIYYIDPYPGIATEHILFSGSKPRELRLFHGAIGNAYHKLYSPFMAYKDELSLLTGLEIKDITSKMKDELKKYKEQFGDLKLS